MPRDGMEGEKPLSDPAEHEKEDISFFTSLEEHFGHSVSFSEARML